MKQFSALSILLLVVLVLLVGALAISQVSLYALREKHAVLLDELASSDYIIGRKYETIQQYRLGAACLVKLSQSEEERSKFMPFLASIDRNGFAFEKFELGRLGGYSVYCYDEAKRNPDLSERPDYSPRSLCLLVDDGTLEVVDSIMGSNGLISVGFVLDQQHLRWENPDGSLATYLIQKTGFALEPAEDELPTDGEAVE